MTERGRREYAEALRPHYQRADRRERGRLLDEYCRATGCHRKAAIRVLRRAPRAAPRPSRAGRPRRYGAEVAAAAEVLWQASGRIGAHRLHPFVPELLDRLLQCDELSLAPTVDKLVRQASRPTLARLLGTARAQYPRRGATTTHPSSWLKQQIPIRTFADWDDARPGFCQIDLVAHCGSSTKGFYRHTLCAVDVATSWVERQALWGKGHYRVAAGVQAVRTRLPVPLAGLDSDNGSEFIPTASCTTTAGGRASSSRAAGPGRKTTARSWSRRMALSCATSSALIASPPSPPLLSSPTSTRWPACLEAALERLWSLAAPDPSRASGGLTSVATPLVQSSPGGAQAMPSVTLTNELTETEG